jgi:hypothetical protein
MTPLFHCHADLRSEGGRGEGQHELIKRLALTQGDDRLARTDTHLAGNSLISELKANACAWGVIEHDMAEKGASGQDNWKLA